MPTICWANAPADSCSQTRSLPSPPKPPPSAPSPHTSFTGSKTPSPACNISCPASPRPTPIQPKPTGNRPSPPHAACTASSTRWSMSSAKRRPRPNTSCHWLTSPKSSPPRCARCSTRPVSASSPAPTVGSPCPIRSPPRGPSKFISKPGTANAGGWLRPCLVGLVLLSLVQDSVAVTFPLRWRWSNPRPHGNNIVDMDYSPALSLGVQVTERGQLYTSDDLSSWLPRDSGVTNALRAVTFFGSRIVVTADSGVVLYADSVSDFKRGTLLDGSTGDWLEAVTGSTQGLVALGDNGAGS